MNKQDKLNNTKNKVVGELKEAAGKITGNEQLELKGKIQSKKADFNRKSDVGNNFDKIKENIAGKINDSIDKQDKKNKIK